MNIRRATFLFLFIIPIFCIGQATDISKSSKKAIPPGILLENGYQHINQINSSRPDSNINGIGGRADCNESIIPVDVVTYTAMARSDDGSEFIADLGFEFSFCDTVYTSCYINTNGNLSFLDAVQQWYSNGFPDDFPIIAPFWGDVDTRNPACGQIWYKLFSNYLIVTWDEVGFYNYSCDPLNTFQVIISDGTAPIIGIGNNIQFRYGQMGWATGQDSGSAPFNGIPSTVGYNTGDSVTFEQVGLFNQDNAGYDGPFGNNDGLHFLDFNCFEFATGSGNITLTCMDIERSLDDSCSVSITPEEIASFSFDGCGNVNLSLDISDFSCEHLGTNTVTITATSGGITETCTAIVTITEGLCASNEIDPVGPFCESDPAFTLTSTIPGGTWGPNTPNGLFDPSAVGAGIYTATYTHQSACPETATFDIEVFASPTLTISPDSTQFCQGQDSLILSASAMGGTGSYTFEWNTPMGLLTGDTINATVSGTYNITVTDESGCADIDSTEVVIHPLLEPAISGVNSFCNEDTVTIDAGPGFVSYQWNIAGETNQTLEVNATGTYFVTVTDNNGCTGVDDHTVTQVENPLPVITGPDSFCAGDSITLDAGGPYNTYSWEGGDDQQTLVVSAPGTYEVTVTTIEGCSGNDEFTVSENEPPQPDITGDMSFCENGLSTLEVGVFSSYLWSDSTSNPTLIVDSTDTYSVTVTDANGCTGVDQVNVIENANPQPEITGTNTFCLGDSTNLNAGIYNSYLWSTGDTSQTVVVNSSGTINVTVTDINGCMGSDNINITVTPNPNPTIAGSTTFCTGNSTTLDAGGPYDNYAWSTGDTSQTIQVTMSDTYTVTVTNLNGCSGIAQVEVTESSELNPVISGDTLFCFGTSTILDAGAGFITYNWTGGFNSQTLEVSTPGVYSVTVSDNSGCTGETTVSVTENPLPSVSITGDDSFCSGGSTILDAGDSFASYIWSDSSLNQTLSVSTGGLYSVTVTDLEGCTNSTQINIFENNNPEPVITGSDSFCEGGMVSLDAGMGYTQYLWSLNDTATQTLEVSVGGTYFVTVTDSNGCTGIDQFTVTENQIQEPDITGVFEFCEGGNTTLTANTGYDEYLWSDGSTTDTITVDSSGNYSVTVTDMEGCTAEATVIVIENPNPTPTITGPSTFCTGTSTVLNAGGGYMAYEWTGGSINQTLEVSSPGIIIVTVTDVNGCTGEDQILIEENDSLNPTITGDFELCDGEISTLDAGAGFTSYIWSNSDTTQTIDISVTGNYSVTVSDASGCTGDDTVFLMVNDNPSVSISGDDTFCDGGNTVLSANNGFDSYEWTGGFNDSTLIVTTTGTYGVTVTDNNDCTAEDQFSVSVLSSPEPVISGPGSFCSGNTATLDGGAGYQSYLWSNGFQTQTITVSTENTYCLTVTNANGCVGDTCFAITENTSLSPDISGDLSFCDGASTLLDAGSGYVSYEWSNGDTTQTTEITQAGNISVLVTDVDGCSGSDVVTLVLNPDPDPMIGGSTSFCTGGSTTLDAGSGYISYNWSTGDTTQTIIVSTPQVVSVNVIDNNGCEGSAMITIEESSSLNPGITGVLSFCENENTSLNAGSGFETYNWSNGDSTQIITVGSPGNYAVTVTDSQGCTGEDAVFVSEVSPPVAELESNTEICNTTSGGSVLDLYDLILSGDAGGTWQDVDNSGAAGQFNNLNFNGITPGIYEFIYTTNSAVSPCEEVEYAITVTVLNCDCPSVLLSEPDPLCNSSETLDVSTLENTNEPGNWSIIQTPAGINPASINGNIFDATAADPGNYVLQFELTNQPPDGCPTVFTTDVQVDPQVNSGMAGLPLSYCFEEDQVVALEAMINGEDVGGIWSETSAFPTSGNAFDDVNGTFETFEQYAGNYSFEYLVLSGNACPNQSTEVFVSINELPVVVVTQDIQLSCLDPMTSLDASGSSEGLDFSIIWNGPGIVMDGNETSLTPTVNQPGNYSITITNTTTGCSASAQSQVTTNDVFPNAFAGNDDELTCMDTSINLLAQGDTGAGYEIVWQGPGIDLSNMNLINPEISIPGLYILTINDETNGCSSLPDTVMVVDAMVDPDVFINTPLIEITCADPVVSLDGGSTTPNVTFQWLDPGMILISNTEEASGISTEGTYTLLVTDVSNGCTAIETAMVSMSNDLPNADAGIPGLINCYNENVTLDGSASDGGPNFSYSWSGPAGGILGPEDGIMAVASLPGIYTITVFNMNTGCSDSSDVEVDADTNPPNVQISNPEQLDCSGNEITLDGTGSSIGNNISYSWTNNDSIEISTSLQTIASEPGVYNLIVFDSVNGCSNSASVNVSYNDEVLTSALIQVLELDCHDDLDGAISIFEPIGGTAPYLYALNGAPLNENNFFPNLPAGSYDLSIEDANGCQWDTTINIQNPEAVDIDLGPDLELFWGDSITIDAQINLPVNQIDTILWTPDNILNCADGPFCLEGVINTFNTVIVSATLIDINGCRDTDNLTIHMNKNRSVYIPTAFSPNDDGDNDVFMIFANLKDVVKVNRFVVFNRWGGKLHETRDFLPNDPDYGWDGKIKGKPLNPAVFVYIAEIEFIDGQRILYKGDITLLH